MKKQISTLLIGLLSLASCGSDEIIEKPVECPPPIPQEYKLVSIKFEPDSTGFTTVPGEPEVFRFTNYQSTLITSNYQCQRKRLETSCFYLPENKLPEDNNINEILANIPDIDGEPKIVGNTYPKFKFAFGKEQDDAINIEWPIQTVNIAPRSIVIVTEQFVGYELKATYHAILENIHSGQRLELTGKWKGMKQNNEETVLNEEKLNS